MYSPSNPKVDIFVNGEYFCSTNWSRTAKEALATFVSKRYGITIDQPYHRLTLPNGDRLIAAIDRN